jgi:hypothetical protein
VFMALAFRRGGLWTGHAVAWPIHGPWPKRPGSSRWSAWRAPGARSPRARPVQWCGQRQLAGGQGAARSAVQGPSLSGEGTGHEEKGWGSP